MTDHTMVILALAFARGCDIYVEQPTSSLMPEYPIAKELFQWANVVKVSTCLKAFGSESCKPLIVYTSSKRAVSLARKREFSETKLAVHDAHGVTGRSTALKKSQAYPEQFGKEVAKTALRSLYSRTFEDVFG